ncbi:MAG: hypothetical protein CMP47_16360 [Rickettsiales bacterium]|nr:hypothetical protein [Rickettsiales bacterium]
MNSEAGPSVIWEIEGNPFREMYFIIQSLSDSRIPLRLFYILYHKTHQFSKLANKLAERGHSSTRIDKILGLNGYNFIKEVWK